MRPINTKELADQDIIALVTAFDRQGLPLDRRFEGDDDILRNFMKNHEISHFAANVAIVLCVLLREATIRGLVISQVN
jgi:hypothetical protein